MLRWRLWTCLVFAEEGGEVVEVLLVPVVEGMVVAHRAADAHPEEDLRGGGGELHRIGVVAEDVSHRRDWSWRLPEALISSRTSTS